MIASGLLAELDAELQRRYPGEPVHGIDATEFQAAGDDAITRLGVVLGGSS